MTDSREGHLGLEHDEQRNIIRVLGGGRWTLGQFERHMRAVEVAFRRARRVHGYVRLLVDLRGAAMQQADVAKRMTVIGEKLYKPYDRVAILAISELVKYQLQGTRRQAIAEVFLSPEAAERWLLAHDTCRSGPALELEWG